MSTIVIEVLVKKKLQPAIVSMGEVTKTGFEKTIAAIEQPVKRTWFQHQCSFMQGDKI